MGKKLEYPGHWSGYRTGAFVLADKETAFELRAWDRIDVVTGTVGRAQDGFSAKLFSYLPSRAGLRILDIGEARPRKS